MRKFINGSEIPLSMAVFLAHDGYDYEENTISATSLIKPIRQIVLADRVPEADRLVDIHALVKSRMGQAIHDGIEQSWKQHYVSAMKSLGYPEKVIHRIRINPDPDDLAEDDIPVYLEQREYRKIKGYMLSGKFDFVAEGRVEDFKTTSVFTWIYGTKDEDYRLQGSIYRWLNPKKITQDEMAINFLFTDFQSARAKREPNYPPTATPQKRIPLMSVEETEAWIRNKLTQIEKYQDAPESDIPYCTDKELWRKDPVFKYYKNPEKTKRATKNFNNRQDAYNHMAKEGGKGTVIEVEGEVMACHYCPAYSVCSQKDELIADGSLKL